MNNPNIIPTCLPTNIPSHLPTIIPSYVPLNIPTLSPTILLHKSNENGIKIQWTYVLCFVLITIFVFIIIICDKSRYIYKYICFNQTMHNVNHIEQVEDVVEIELHGIFIEDIENINTSSIKFTINNSDNN
tara:strand:+ start:1974 stop:2366 length:393 start_codon:yes stop_codon:yes gene_type:complete